MIFESIRFQREVAELALKVGTELDRRLRCVPNKADPAVAGLLSIFHQSVQSPIHSVIQFQEMYVLYRDVIAMKFPAPLKTTSDLVGAVTNLSGDWTVTISTGALPEIDEIMRTCLDIHQFCLERSEHRTLGLAA
jgi:hypothetical protein